MEERDRDDVGLPTVRCLLSARSGVLSSRRDDLRGDKEEERPLGDFGGLDVLTLLRESRIIFKVTRDSRSSIDGGRLRCRVVEPF